MKASLRFAGLCGTAIFCLVPAGRADAPSGNYSINIDAPARLYDISDTYDQDLDDLSMHYTLNVDAKGKIGGGGHASVSDGANYLNADLTFSGAMSTAGSVTRVRFSLKMAGSGEVEGHYATFSAVVTVNLEIDPTAQEMVGLASGRVSVRVPGYGSQSARLPPESFSMELPADMDGSWSVTLSEVHPVTTSGRSLASTGAILLSNGNSIPFNVTGSYSPRTDQAHLTLKGTPESRGASLRLTTTSSQGAINLLSFKGKVLGQKLQPPTS